MARNYIEKRIVKAGAELCKRRIDQKGTPITADDIRDLKVRTLSPVLQGFYTLVGLGFIVFGIWAHVVSRSMAVSFVPVLMGVANVAYGIYGNPRSVRNLGEDVDIMGLTTDIVQRFVGEMDAKRDARGREQSGGPDREN